MMSSGEDSLSKYLDPTNNQSSDVRASSEGHHQPREVTTVEEIFDTLGAELDIKTGKNKYMSE